MTKSSLVLAGLLCAGGVGAFAACGDDVSATGGGDVHPRDRPECQGYENEAPAEAVTFRLRNDSGADAYVAQGCAGPFLSVASSPDPTVSHHPNSPCLDTCVDIREGALCPPELCDTTSLRVPAGSSVDIVWDAMGVIADSMPDTCFAAPHLGTCDRFVVAPAGSYEIDLQVFSGCGPDCTCDASNVCNGAAAGVKAPTEGIAFTYPASSVVEVVLPLCVFGCGDG